MTTYTLHVHRQGRKIYLQERQLDQPVRDRQRRLPLQTHMLNYKEGNSAMCSLPSWLYQRRAEGLQRRVCLCVCVPSCLRIDVWGLIFTLTLTARDCSYKRNSQHGMRRWQYRALARGEQNRGLRDV